MEPTTEADDEHSHLAATAAAVRLMASARILSVPSPRASGATTL